MSQLSEKLSINSSKSNMGDYVSEKLNLGPVFALASIFGLRMLSLFMILPVFALYTGQFQDVTPYKTGLALGIYGLTQALFQIPFGMLSDRFGRKTLIIIGLLLFIMGSLIAAMSQSINGVILGRFLQGGAAIGSVIMALAADLSSERFRSQAMAIIGIIIGASFALAFILGPIMSHWLSGVRGLFFLSAFLAFLSIIILILFVPRKLRCPILQLDNTNCPNSRLDTVSTFNTLLTNRKFMLLNLGILCLHASLTALFLKIPLIIENLGFVKADSWHVYLPVFILSLFISFPVLYFLDKLSLSSLKLKNSLLLIIFIFVLSEIALLSFKPLILFFIAFTLFFATFNILEAGLPALISKAVEPHHRGTAMGVFSSCQFFGLFLGGLLGGLMNTHFTQSGIMVLCFILALIWFIFVGVFFKNK